MKLLIIILPCIFTLLISTEVAESSGSGSKASGETNKKTTEKNTGTKYYGSFENAGQSLNEVKKYGYQSSSSSNELPDKPSSSSSRQEGGNPSSSSSKQETGNPSSSSSKQETEEDPPMFKINHTDVWYDKEVECS